MEVTREALYAQVWAEPMRILARKYSISDVALAKWCKKLLVPVPGRGYWAKKAAGYKMKQKPLPPLPPGVPREDQTVTLSQRKAAEAPTDEPETLRAQRLFEALPEHRILVLDSLRGSHPFVRKQSALFQAKDDAFMQMRDDPHLDIAVSEPMQRRALVLMDALLKALEARGFTPSLGKGDYRHTYATVHGHRIAFGIREGTKRTETVPPKNERGYDGVWRTPYYAKYTFNASGVMTLFIRSWYASTYFRTWTDGKRQRVEDCLNEFMVLIVARAEEQRELEVRRERERQERVKEEERRYHEQQRRVREAERVRGLEQEASHWLKSRELKSYLAAVRETAMQRRGEIDPTSELGEWLEWATRYADSLDPLRPRPERADEAS